MNKTIHRRIRASWQIWGVADRVEKVFSRIFGPRLEQPGLAGGIGRGFNRAGESNFLRGSRTTSDFPIFSGKHSESLAGAKAGAVYECDGIWRNAYKVKSFSIGSNCIIISISHQDNKIVQPAPRNSICDTVLV